MKVTAGRSPIRDLLVLVKPWKSPQYVKLRRSSGILAEVIPERIVQAGAPPMAIYAVPIERTPVEDCSISWG